MESGSDYAVTTLWGYHGDSQYEALKKPFWQKGHGNAITKKRRIVRQNKPGAGKGEKGQNLNTRKPKGQGEKILLPHGKGRGLELREQCTDIETPPSSPRQPANKEGTRHRLE